ncbi:putative radical SAM enzyme, TIGR03279 family [Thermosyntropha lipolytica DSM 11003]|uniref:Putative radical SAM enzyme, TIGR03279 family n=1 Tax=Thermosyntropha lipolytica DSM 11003 TaxID=1123382 RepID=A0A1M5NN65_9FIRM|nr:DUF512 domain-containing protein [Thermosyntropha lipolytica]SHG90629.1 putative radical SAM enzyme, TIGR03279 family [Thermosyntropha lipolytica DSM 11003]
MGACIIDIIEGSIAEEIGLEKGDILLSINGQEIKDILDYQFYVQDEFIVIDVKKTHGEIITFEIEKDEDEELGVLFADIVFDRMKVCRNRCIFCFVDQMPPGMRKTLYIKDDDFRYSFLYGNFITLTNLKEKDWEKIIAMRLSPLYVSVHCMDPELRAKMLNNPKAKNISRDLKRLKDAGIEVHTQIVLCPGINDGVVLKESIEKLASFYPSVYSVGIVPVGLTKYRDNLFPLRSFTRKEAEEIIRLVDEYQKRFRKRLGRGLVYLADEFFIKAGQPFPPADYYDDYCQIENGIGMARILLDEFAEIIPELPQEIEPKEAFIVTGVSGIPVLEPIVDRLNLIEGLSLKLIPVKNEFFGEQVTVTGLLTGQDIINTLKDGYRDKIVIIPQVVCREGEEILLDDISLEDIKKATRARIYTVDGSAHSLVQTVLKSR